MVALKKITIILLYIFILGQIQVAEPKAKVDVQVEEEKTQVARKYEGRTIEEWITQWDENNFKQNQEAKRALVAIGEPVVPVLVRLIEDNHRHSGQAFQTLGDMGPVAEKALPVLIKIALDKDAIDPEGWTWNVPMRCLVFTSLGKMNWAADELIPVLKTIGEDSEESEDIHVSAVWALKDMGQGAILVLRTFANSESDQVRIAANNTLAQLVEKEGIQTKSKFYTDVIENDPFDASVPKYLTRMKGLINYGRPHLLTNKIKAMYRQRLQLLPDAELAWQLATIIQNGLVGTKLEWAAPTDRGSSQQNREDPVENFETLSEILLLGFSYSEPQSELSLKFGTSLAKLYLLQGEWDGMNAMLKALGQEPIPKESRPWLHAPPVDWGRDLHSRWGLADESMRSGNCSLEFQIEKDGKGLAGVHFLVKRASKPTNVFRTGIRKDTLFLAPYPIEFHRDSFGYRGSDSEKTRYAVSDSSGIVRFDRLPNIPIKIEVLVPTSNFTEAGSNWDLWMEVAPGEYKIAKAYGGRESVQGWYVDSPSPPAVVRLKESETVYYPKLVVRPAFAMNIRDWQKVDKNNFELSWHGLDATTNQANVHYELEMILSAPGDINQGIEHGPVVRSAKQSVETNHWPVSEKGVGGLHLQPGNIYIFEVRAVDESGIVIARWPRTRVWTEWEYRESAPPFAGQDTYDKPPIHHEVWHRGTFGYGDGREETLREKVARFLSEYPNFFEYEYVQLGKAWLDWRDDDHSQARQQLKQLREVLPKGNVVRGTAIWLLQQMDEGKPPPKRLNFVPDQDTNSSEAVSKELAVQVEGKLLFSPAVEVTVNDGWVGIDNAIDFDTGKLFSFDPQVPSRTPKAFRSFFQQNGADVHGSTERHIQGLACEDMIFSPVDNSYWDTAEAQLMGKRSWEEFEAGYPAYMTAQGQLPVTYFFKTREGGIGILQITGFSDEPKGVKIRYKMVQTVESIKPDVQVEVEKPSAAENTEETTQFKATLPNSVTVQLVGVTNYPSKNQPWWQADGTVLADPPYDSSDLDIMSIAREDIRKIELAFKLGGNTRGLASEVPFKRSNGKVLWWAGRRSKNGQILDDIKSIAINCLSKQEKLTLRLYIAAGSWKTVASGTHLGPYKIGNDTVVLNMPAGYKPKERPISVTHKIADHDLRVVLLEKDGQLHEGKISSPSSNTEDIKRMNIIFPNRGGLKGHKSLIQTRPYEWVEFKNVSLRPNFKTDVQIEVEKPDNIENLPTPFFSWYDDLEAGNFDMWESKEDNPGIVDFDSHSGTYSAELEGGYERFYKQGNFRSDSIVKLFPKTPQLVTVDAWIKVTQWSEAWADIHFSFLKNPKNLFEGIGRFWLWSQAEGYYFNQTQDEKRFAHNLPMNQWNHLKLCYDITNGGTIRYYENDVLQLTIVNAGTGISGFFIGAGGCCGPVKFLVDDVSYYIENTAQSSESDVQIKVEKTDVQVEGEETQLVWGEDVNGLRAAVGFVPEKESYSLGERVVVFFHIQNVSNHDIQIASTEWRQENWKEEQIGRSIFL
ncbi:HEAT repeat domain-containing protein [Planctomycetota bacterium]